MTFLKVFFSKGKRYFMEAAPHICYQKKDFFEIFCKFQSNFLQITLIQDNFLQIPNYFQKTFFFEHH